jgi:hypothetical protein
MASSQQCRSASTNDSRSEPHRPAWARKPTGKEHRDGYDQAPSRVHELSHLDLTGLVALYQRTYQDMHGSPPIPVQAHDRDQVIRLIRDLEAPQPTPGDHAGC